MLKQGDRIFYTDNTNGQRYAGYCQVAIKTIRDLGLTYFFYPSISLKIRESNLDAETREDFYKAKVVILVLGKGKDWHELCDNWAIPELDHASKYGIKFLIYTTAKLTKDEVEKIRLPVNPIFIRNQKHFKTILRDDLEGLGIDKSLKEED